MTRDNRKIGWIGIGSMGYAMAERLLKAGRDVSIWNPTRAKAVPLAKLGGKLVDKPADLAGVDVLFSIVSTGKDLEQVYFGDHGALTVKDRVPPVVVDCSTIAVDGSADIRRRIAALGANFVAAPVSGNAKMIKAGKLSVVASGDEATFRTVDSLIRAFAPRGVSYVGDGELARVCKIAHDVMFGVVTSNLIEVMLLAGKMGVSRDAFLGFMNNGVMGAMFTACKSPVLVDRDGSTAFTPEILRKDLDLGLELGRENGVPMPVTAAARELVRAHFGAAQLQNDPREYLSKDFAALAETLASMVGMARESDAR